MQDFNLCSESWWPAVEHMSSLLSGYAAMWLLLLIANNL